MTRAQSDVQTWSLFLALSLIWGSSYLLIKIALDEGVAPLTLVSLRTLLGTAFLAVVMRWQRARYSWPAWVPSRWRRSRTPSPRSSRANDSWGSR